MFHCEYLFLAVDFCGIKSTATLHPVRSAEAPTGVITGIAMAGFALSASVCMPEW